MYTVKKGLTIFTSLAGMSLTKLFLAEKGYFFPARESFGK
jgi:hypothetical protein